MVHGPWSNKNALAGGPGGRKQAPMQADSLFPAVSVDARSKRQVDYIISAKKKGNGQDFEGFTGFLSVVFFP
jgi:hypothetical protein